MKSVSGLFSKKAKLAQAISFIAMGSLFSGAAMADANFSFVSEGGKEANTKVVFADNAKDLDGALAMLNSKSDGRIAQLIAVNDFDASFGSTLHLQAVAGTDSLLIVGTKESDIDKISAAELQNLGGKIAGALSSTTEKQNIDIHVDNLATDIASPSAHIAYGFELRDYSFDRYKSKKSEGESAVTVITPNADGARSKFNDDLRYVAQGVHLARDFATEPGKNMYPEAFVEVVKAKFKGIKNVDIDVLDMRDIKKLGMGALAGVGTGSINDPRLLVISYRGADKKEAPVALVGKGITFDTGGISLKQNSGMWAMKSDLSGAAAVAGAMYASAKRGENINLVGLMPLAENMPSQDAIRPGDVLETMKGVSIEIMSTDAEGRLVLADAVYYAQEEFKPRMLLNIATLTGSAARALSDEYAAVITRDFELSTQMMAIGESSGEHVWPLPLHPNHFEQIKSPIADIKNSGAGNPGASIGAAVVATFIDEDLPWVHLDIAGVDWLDAGNDVAPKGSQGWGVRFMDQLVREQVK
jgi:leucyl aminopeptidase